MTETTPMPQINELCRLFYSDLVQMTIEIWKNCPLEYKEYLAYIASEPEELSVILIRLMRGRYPNLAGMPLLIDLPFSFSNDEDSRFTLALARVQEFVTFLGQYINTRLMARQRKNGTWRLQILISL